MKEAILTLSQGPANLTELCLQLGTEMLLWQEHAATLEARRKLEDSLQQGRALAKFRSGWKPYGDPQITEDLSRFRKPSSGSLAALKAGHVQILARCSSHALGRGGDQGFRHYWLWDQPRWARRLCGRGSVLAEIMPMTSSA